ncbi:Disease resistance protein [Nymphaea thermarum]|nr:Disease resistance protein [Nymphaea thermarum]
MKTALVILDDVDRVDQIDELLNQQHLFAAGSKIIVTTKCEDVLIMKGIENHKIYKPNELDEDESLKLFSHHAFLSERPLEPFVELSKQVVQLTGGLPLELEIFGSLFYNIRTEDEWEEMLIDLGTEAFERLHPLRLLRVNFANFKNNDFRNFPEDLKWLEWRGCPSESLPLDCRFKKLSILILSQSNITQLWNESAPSGTELNMKLEEGVFHGLKVLDLSFCAHLNSSPGFASVPNLQKLILDDCTSLTELDESLGCLEELKFLSMRMCENLTRLPNNMHQLLSLENLILRNCSKLSAIPKLPSSLITLDAEDCTDLQMPLDFSNLTNLKSLNLEGCKMIEYFNGLGGLESIEVLLMDGCERLSSDFMEKFQGMRFEHLKEFSITGSRSYFETLGEAMVFMFPYGSEKDPLLMDYVRCHGDVIDDKNHRNIMVLIRYYAGDEVKFEAVKEACRDDDNDLEDHNRGYCYTLNLNGNDEVTRQLTAFYNKIYISTADGSLLRRIDMKLRHNNYWAGNTS